MSRLTSSDSADPPAVADPYPEGWDGLEYEELYLDGAPEFPDRVGSGTRWSRA